MLTHTRLTTPLVQPCGDGNSSTNKPEEGTRGVLDVCTAHQRQGGPARASCYGFFFLVLVAGCVEQLAGAEGLHALRSCSGGCVRTGRNPFASGLLTELCFTFGFID